MYEPGSRRLVGVEAVIDKDRASAVLALGLRADLLVIATDVDGVYLHWGTPEQTLVAEANPDSLESLGFAAGSMGPKVEAASAFARESGKAAVIGSLDHLTQILDGTSGTRVDVNVPGIVARTTD
jgi:carbamate kinase